MWGGGVLESREYKKGMNSGSKWQDVMIDLMWGKERLFKSMPRFGAGRLPF